MKYTDRLKQLREQSGLNQTQIAKMLNYGQTAYSKWELGQRDIAIDNLIKLAQFYNVDMNYITGITDKRKPFPNKKG